MIFRTTIRKFTGTIGSYTLPEVPLDTLKLTILLNNTIIFDGFADTLTTSTGVKDYAYTINFTDTLLAINWATPLDEVNKIKIIAWTTTATLPESYKYEQEFEVFGYDLGLNPTNGNGYKDMDIILYPITHEHTDGLLTKAVSYRQPYTDRVVFYDLVSRFYGSTILDAFPFYNTYDDISVTYSWILPTSAIYYNNGFNGEYTNNSATTISSVLVVKHTYTNVVITVPQVNLTDVELTSNWLPTFTEEFTHNTLEGTIELKLNSNFTILTKVFVDNVKQFVFGLLRFDYLLNDQIGLEVKNTSLTLSIGDIDTFIYIADSYKFTAILNRYSRHTLITKVTPVIETVSIYNSEREIIPSSFQFISKIGCNQYTIFNPYYDKTLTYQLQVLNDSNLFVNEGDLITIQPDDEITLSFNEGVYNVIIDGANGILTPDCNIKTGIVNLITKLVTCDECECTTSGCDNEYLINSLIMLSFTYQTMITSLKGEGFLFPILDVITLNKAFTIKQLQQRITKLLSLI